MLPNTFNLPLAPMQEDPGGIRGAGALKLARGYALHALPAALDLAHLALCCLLLQPW